MIYSKQAQAQNVVFVESAGERVTYCDQMRLRLVDKIFQDTINKTNTNTSVI